MSHVVGTKRIKGQKRGRVDELLKELEDIPDEAKHFFVDNEDIVALDEEMTDRTSIVKHTIDRGDAKAISLRPRTTPLQFQDFVSEEIGNMLKTRSLGRLPQRGQHP